MKEEGGEVKEEAKEDADVQMKEEPKEEPEATPVAELDEEESRLWFLPRSTTDMVSVTFNSTFADFTLPDETENFSEIRYEWAGEVASKDYMKSWMQAKKITTRVEDLFPDDTFTNRVLEWQRVQGDWQYRQKEFKTDPVRQQAANTRMEKEKKFQEKLNKPKIEEKEGGEGEAEAAPPEGEDAAELEGFVPVDIHTVEDVLDIGEGEPLFAHFAFEDWALMNLRFEMAMLMSAFAQAVVDPDRPGVHEAHLTYYYNRYFRKPLNVKYFGANNSVELCELIKDVVTVLDNGILRPTLTEEQLINQDIFARLTEEDRRERQRLIDAGDESIRLKLSVLAQQQMNQPSPWAAKAAPKAWATQAAWPGVGPAPVAARPGFVRGPGAAGGKGAGWDWAPTNFGGPPAWGGGKGGYPPMGPMGGMGGMGW
ncbi:Hnrnpu [Symbiodinium sp. CCMP2592]|nr:Hnrnpu [Symbiodinium sp. CCMP2592]